MVYAFLAVDEYSKYVFTLGVDKNLTDLSILFHLHRLLDHNNFKVQRPDFILIMSVGKNIESDIQKLIGSSGKVVFDEERAITEITPVVASFMEYMEGL